MRLLELMQPHALAQPAAYQKRLPTPTSFHVLEDPYSSEIPLASSAYHQQ